jgi:MFS family permease
VPAPFAPASPCPEPPPGPAASVGGRIARRLAAALTHRDFRILWLGAFTSTIGTWMQNVAKNWLVLDLTQSSFYLGLDSFFGELPLLLFTLIGGVIADRHTRRRLLMSSQYVQMMCAVVLMVLVYSGAIGIWHILVLSFLAGTAQAFGGPAYQSLIPALVPKEDLPNAVALNSIQFNLARIIGPLVAGTTLAWLGSTLGQSAGTAACFGLNALSFVAVIVGLRMLRTEQRLTSSGTNLMTELRGGLGYVRGDRPLITLTVLAFVSTFLGVPLLTFLPVIAKDVFHQGVWLYSWMLAWSGAGAVTGALIVAWIGRHGSMGRTLLVAQGLFGLLLMAFAWSRDLWLSNALLFVASGLLMVVLSTLTSLVQLIAPDHMRGRVMSIYMVAFRGGMPLGSLVAGYVASLSSAPLVLGISGGLLGVVALVGLARGEKFDEG